MPPLGAEQLVVRQHERFLCRLASQVRVAPDMAEQVVMSRSVGDHTGAVDVVVTDASRGGLGIESTVFFPRGCRLQVRVTIAGATAEQDLSLRVQRVTMLDRTPTYYLGLSFVSKGPEHDQRVGLLLEMARQAVAAAALPIAPVKGGG
jgi:hypothetical protein